MKQVITIKPGGLMEGLQVKPGKGVDLRQFGRANIQRASAIIWDEMEQKWFVQLLCGRFSGCCITKNLCFTYGVEFSPHVQCLTRESADATDDNIYFEEYDEAVAAEIEFLNAARLKSLIT